jgi:rhodanese-related sulfurtransferase
MPKSLADFVTEARARIREMSAADLNRMTGNREDLLIVDVREGEEYAAAHLGGAVLVPRGTLEAAADPGNKHRVPPLWEARERPVVVYCDTGARGAMAADTLQQMGFKEVYNLAGGIVLWIAEDLPVVSETPATAWVT